MAARNNVREVLVSYAIEKALTDYGQSAMEEVYYKLYRDYALHFEDCYHNPDMLRQALRELFGDSYVEVVELIRRQLGEFAMRESVKTFLRSLY